MTILPCTEPTLGGRTGCVGGAGEYVLAGGCCQGCAILALFTGFGLNGL